MGKAQSKVDRLHNQLGNRTISRPERIEPQDYVDSMIRNFNDAKVLVIAVSKQRQGARGISEGGTLHGDASDLYKSLQGAVDFLKGDFRAWTSKTDCVGISKALNHFASELRLGVIKPLSTVLKESSAFEIDYRPYLAISEDIKTRAKQLYESSLHAQASEGLPVQSNAAVGTEEPAVSSIKSATANNSNAESNPMDKLQEYIAEPQPKAVPSTTS